METLRTKQQAERMREQFHRDPEAHRHVPTVRAEDAPTGAGRTGITASPGDSIDMDPAALAEAERQLGLLYVELAGYQQQAATLNAELTDGKGPVALHMRRSFHVRASDQGGVQATLTAYLQELAGLREAIGQVRARHEANEQNTVAALRDASAETAGEPQ